MNTAAGKTVLVTGASDGIGRETAVALARRGARVVAHGRSLERVAGTVAALRELRPDAALEPLVLDLSRLDDVRGAGAELARRGVAVDVVIHNAGVFMRERQRSADGFEMTLAVNYLAPFVLSHVLLRAAGGASLARIVNVSSIAHGRGAIDHDDLSFERRGFDPYGTYAASKLALVMFTAEAARRIGRRPTVNALHPGVVSTKLLTEGFGVQGPDSLAKGAATSVRLALDEDVANTTGGYFSDGRPARTHPAVADAALLRQLYERTAAMTGTDPLPAG